MKPVPQSAPAPVVGVRGALADHDRAWVARGRGGPWQRRLTALEAGEPVVVQRWEVAEPWRSAASGGLYEFVRVEPDGELVAVRPQVFHGRHRIGDTVYGNKHAVGYVPVGADGDRSDIVLDLEQVRRQVPDPKNWTLTPLDPQSPQDTQKENPS